MSATTKADASTAATSAMGSMGPDAFMKLLVAQMKYQNPFSPSDPTAMLGQVATYSQVEMLQKLTATASSSQSLQQATLAADMIGKPIVATGIDGKDITGVVTSTRFTADGPVLILNGTTEVALQAVTTVGSPASSAGTSTPTST
jgi:flagellar basal-body rod modification protein FlgD